MSAAVSAAATRPAVAVVSAPHPRQPVGAWLERVAAWDEAGASALLVPDSGALPSVFPVLAAAAAVTERIRLRPWVLAAPLRSAPAVVREAQALQQLSGGRFELGIGTGRPGADADAAALGLPWPGPAQRLALLEEVVDAVRAGTDPVPPVAVTASGPRALALAGRTADVVGLATPPTVTEPELAALAHVVRGAAAQRSDGGPRLAWQVVGVGERLHSFVARSGATAAGLRAAGAAGVLPADADEARDAVAGLVERLGVAELVVPDELVDDVLPLLSA